MPRPTPPNTPPSSIPIGMKVKNTSMPEYPSNDVVWKAHVQTNPSTTPRMPPMIAPKNKPTMASNAVFMVLSVCKRVRAAMEYQTKG